MKDTNALRCCAEEKSTDENADELVNTLDRLFPAIQPPAAPASEVLGCGVCFKPVSQPCWFCVDCHSSGTRTRSVHTTF